MGNVASTLGGAITGGLVGGPIGTAVGSVFPSSVGSAIFGQTPPSPQSQTNSISPQLQQMQQQQVQNAQNYQQNMPAYEQQQQTAARDQSRQALAQQLAGTTANSNSRGMLYGSYNQGQQAQQTAQNQANLQNTYAGINTNAQNQLSQLQGQALGTGLAVNQSQQSENQAAYNMALQQQMSNNQLFGSLLGAGGSGAGLLAGLG